jgi:hypothetical protein
MDLVTALHNTLDKREATRQAAERVLAEAALLPGFLVNLLQIVALPEGAPPAVKQSASIALKNAIRRNWAVDLDAPNATSNISGADKEVIRANLLEALHLVRANDTSRRVLAECVGLIAESDFPQEWPGLTSQLYTRLSQAQDRGTLAAMLLALRRVVKRYEYRRSVRKARDKDQDPRAPVNLIVEQIFPSLLGFAQRLVSDPEEDGSLLRLVAKAYFSATRLEMPPALAQQAAVSAWMAVWEQALRRPLPQSQSGTDELDDLSLRPWWKAKKVVLDICIRQFQEASSPLSTDEQSKRVTAIFIGGGIAGQILVVCMTMLESWVRVPAAAPLPSRVLQLCLNYVATALEPAKTYKILRPHLKFLVADVVLKVLAFTPADQALWNDEPETFASTNLSPLDDPFDARATACSLLCDACKLRSKDVLDGVVQHLLDVLTRRPSAGEMDAAIYAVGALAEVLAPMEIDGEQPKKSFAKRAQKYQTQLELVISRLVVPELHAPEPHVRARAVWCIGQVGFGSVGGGVATSNSHDGFARASTRTLSGATPRRFARHWWGCWTGWATRSCQCRRWRAPACDWCLRWTPTPTRWRWPSCATWPCPTW